MYFSFSLFTKQRKRKVRKEKENTCYFLCPKGIRLNCCCRHSLHSFAGYCDFVTRPQGEINLPPPLLGEGRGGELSQAFFVRKMQRCVVFFLFHISFFCIAIKERNMVRGTGRHQPRYKISIDRFRLKDRNDIGGK